jgi:integrase/recombinase XerD
MVTHRQKASSFGVRITDCQTDEEFIRLWLHGKSSHTRSAYLRDIAYFQAFIESKPLFEIKMEDVAAFCEAMEQQGYAVSSIRRRLYAVKSLLSFGQKVGYISANVGGLVELPKEQQKLSSRILSEEQVLSIIACEPSVRNKIMLRFLYETGCRLGEMCQLKWKHLKPRSGGGQVDIFGKGSKTRHILITKELWDSLQSLRGNSSADEPIFATKSGRHFALSNVVRIVRAAAVRAGITEKVSPHWLRHAHASHSLDRGAPLHLVQHTLGHSSIATTERYLHARPDDSSARYLPK